MTDTSAQRERSRDFERLLTFVDAIVAIAITLLVLPLVDLVGDLDEDRSVRDLLGDHAALVWAFLLSFAVIANLWLVQHRMLRHVVADNRRLTRLLLLWTMTIVFLPFPTALVSGEHGTSGQATTKVLYVGTMASSSLVLGLISLVVARHPDLSASPERPDVVGSFGTAAAFVVALAVMVVVPDTSYWPLLLLVVSDRIVDRLGRLWHRGARAGAVVR
jgi:uncharacterized membrane protein